MNIRNHKIYHRDKQNLEIRLERKGFEAQAEPMFKGTVRKISINKMMERLQNDVIIPDMKRMRPATRIVGALFRVDAVSHQRRLAAWKDCQSGEN